jgi:hypothetical protein
MLHQLLRAVDIAKGYRLTGTTNCPSIPDGRKSFTLIHSVQIGSGAHTASCPVCIRGVKFTSV